MTMYKADKALVVEILRSTDVMTCFPDNLPHDPVLFLSACHAAANKVPFIRTSFHNNQWDTLNISTRLAEALTYRNKWYRDHLGKDVVDAGFKVEFEQR